MEWNEQPCAEGGGGLLGSPPPPIPAAPRAAQTSAVLQVPAQQLGREPSRAEPSHVGRRLRAPRGRPLHPTPPHPTSAAAPPARPARGGLAGMRANGARSPRGPAPRSSPPHPTPRAWRPGGQRRFLAPALGGGRWRFESGPGADLWRRLSRSASCLLSRRTPPPRTPDPSFPG